MAIAVLRAHRLVLKLRVRSPENGMGQQKYGHSEHKSQLNICAEILRNEGFNGVFDDDLCHEASGKSQCSLRERVPQFIESDLSF
jgi:hypothetical protein